MNQPMLVNFGDNDFTYIFAEILLYLGNKEFSPTKQQLVTIINELSYGFNLIRDAHYNIPTQSPDLKDHLRDYLKVNEYPSKGKFQPYVLLGDEVDAFLKTPDGQNAACAYWYPGQVGPGVLN